MMISKSSVKTPTTLSHFSGECASTQNFVDQPSNLLTSDLIMVVLPCLHIREIFRVLDLMKMDMVNLTIDNLRLVLHREGVEYERATFQSILDKTPSECLAENGTFYCSTMWFFDTEKLLHTFSGALDNTTLWIRTTLEELQSSIVTTEQTKSPDKVVPGPFQVLNTALLGILTWDYEKGPLPEVRLA